MPIFVQELYEEYTKAGYFYVIKKTYKLNWVQRIFILLEIPDSSYLSEFFSFLVLFATLLSVITYVLGTVPEYRHVHDTCDYPVCHNDSTLCPSKMICEPIPPVSFQVVEKVCLILFFIDCVCRICTVGTVPLSLAGLSRKASTFDDESLGLENFEEVDPVYSWYYQTILYIHQPVNIIDIVAILPLFFEFGNVQGESLTFIRVLRLARILRILKLGKRSEGVQLLINTIISSVSALTILAFFLTIGVIFLAAILYYFESGTFEVNSTYEGGTYMLRSVYGEDLKSTFISIPVTIYYTIVTTCTVGYGDMYPQTVGGQFIAIVAMYFGVIVLAFPISVIGNRFDKYYDKARGSMSELIAQCVVNLIKPWERTSMYAKPNGKRYLAYEASKKLSSLFVLSKVILDTTNQKKIEELLHEKGLSECIDYAEHMIKFHSKNIKTISTHNINDSNRISYKIVNKRNVESKVTESLLEVVEENIEVKHHKIDATISDILAVPTPDNTDSDNTDTKKQFVDISKEISKEKLEEIEELANAILKYTKLMKSKKMVINNSENSMKSLFDDNDNEADDELVDI